MKNEMSVTKLPNGFYRLFVYGPNWSGLYNEDGSFRGGNTLDIRRLTTDQMASAKAE